MNNRYNPVELIIKKRNGGSLKQKELEHIFLAFTEGELPDYQMAAFLMSVYFQGMEMEEIIDLTKIYINSGKRISFPTRFRTVDKHSTGGVGDKISIVLAPIIAACGGMVPMISGRGLGHTGGTLDKLESIPGFQTNLSEQQFKEQVENIGFAIISQSDDLVPVDRKTYALRDVTGTVDSLPLITASIMSKKIVEGADNLVIDLKVGSGAFIKNMKSAEELGSYLIRVGEGLGQKVAIVYSNMNSPLGEYVGNALEIRECVAYLQGKNVRDIDLLTRTLAREMLILSGVSNTVEEAESKIDKVLKDGSALDKFRALISAQHGNPRICDNPDLLLKAKYEFDIITPESGWINEIDNQKIGYSLIDIQAGRRTLDSEIDAAAGAWLPYKIGDFLESNSVVGKVYCNDPEAGQKAVCKIQNSIRISKSKTEKQELILKILNPVK